MLNKNYVPVVAVDVLVAQRCDAMRCYVLYCERRCGPDLPLGSISGAEPAFFTIYAEKPMRRLHSQQQASHQKKSNTATL